MDSFAIYYVSSAISAGVGFWQLLTDGFAAALILMIVAYGLAAIGEKTKHSAHLG